MNTKQYNLSTCFNHSNLHRQSIEKRILTGLIILSFYAFVFSFFIQSASAGASVSIQSASLDKSTYSPGETVKVKVTIKNGGTVDISNLKINVDIADPNGNNVIASTLKNGISVSKGKTYSTDYTGYYTIPKDSIAGTYKITVGLWNSDSSQQYDIKYRTASFNVKIPPTPKPTTPKPTTPKPTTPKPTTPKPTTPKPTTPIPTTPTPPPKILASVQSVSVEKSAYSPGETVKVKVTIKNGGTVDLSDLKINVDIADPNGNNVIASTLKNGISVSKAKTYSTDYTGYYTIPKDSIAGTYKITVGLWNSDSSQQYDIKYRTASFNVKIPPTPTTPKPTTPKPTTPKPTTPKPTTPTPPSPKILASVQSASVDKSTYVPGETIKVKVTIKNGGTIDISNLKINVDITDPNGNNVIASTLKGGISVSKGKTYSTDYTGYYTIPKNPVEGTYKVTIGLWNPDSSTRYDIKYQTTSFNVKLPLGTSASIQLDGLTYQYDAAQSLYYLNGKKVNSELNELLKILSKHVKKGEKINSIKPVLKDNKYYTIYYFFTGDTNDHYGEVLLPTAPWTSLSIRSSIVISNNRIETNKEILRLVYGSALSGYNYMHSSYFNDDIDILIEKTMLQDINEITNSPIFIMQGGKSYLSGGEEVVYRKILRELVSQRDDKTILPAETVSFLETTLNMADSGINAAKAFDDAVKTGTYSINPRVRQTVQTMGKNIKNWEYVKTGNNKYLKIAGKKVPWTYAPTIIKGAIAITQQQVYEQERIKMLEDILQYSKRNNIKIDPSLEAAMVAVIKEGNDANTQMFDKFVEFVVETAVDKGTDKGIDLSLDAFSKWAFNTLGHNSYLAHSAAGAANQLVLGLTVSNLLYNMDGIYENAIKAKYSQKLAENLDKINDDLRQVDRSKTYYDSSRAKLYQDAYYFKVLAVAHFYDSYGTLVDSADFIRILKDVQTSGDLSEKALDLHQQAKTAVYNYGQLFGTKNIDGAISNSK